MPLLGSAGSVSAGRRGLEWGVHVLVVALLGWYLFHVLRTQAGDAAEVATSAELRSKLVRWSTVTAPARVHTALDYPPPPEEREWLAALAGTGTGVTWSGTALVPTAVMMEPIADPVYGADLAVAAPSGAPVILRDALGAFDTVPVGAHGVHIYLPNPPAMAQAAVGPVVATAQLRDSLRLGRLLLLAGAGWEAKFVAAALDERGWKIDALMAVSPKGQGDVRQGKIGAVDTATYSAVVAIDTIADRYAQSILRYVQSGGGLVLWATAAAGKLAALAPGTPGLLLPDPGRIPTDTAPRAALALVPLERLKPDALTLERSGGRTTVAAWRIGAGRVIQTGYINTWRWRMAGLNGTSQSASDAHRDWLARMVATVAYTSRQSRPATAADAAPLATLIGQLGTATAPVRPGRDPASIGAWIFGLIVAAVFFEWTSRRLRGVR